MRETYLTIVLAPLIAAIVAGLFGRRIGRAGAHVLTIAGVGLSFGLSAWVLKSHAIDGVPVFNEALYTWGVVSLTLDDSNIIVSGSKTGNRFN